MNGSVSAAHAQRMDAIYFRQRKIYDLTRKYYLLGRDRLIGKLDVPTKGSVLEIGCGTGRNLIKVAKRYRQVNVYGLDISEAMLETARASILRAGLGERITLAQGDATGFDAAAAFDSALFDRVYFSYTLSMIPDWRAALRCALNSVAPGGALYVVDFGQQERLPAAFRVILHRWLKKFGVIPVADLSRELKDIAAESGAKSEVVALYRGYAWSAKVSVEK